MLLLSSVALGIFVYWKGKDNKVVKVFSFFCSVLIFWAFGGYKVATTTSYEIAFFWWQIANIGVILCPVVFANFIFVFLKIINKRLVFLMYSLVTIFIAFDLFAAPSFLGDLRFVFNQFYWPYWNRYKSISYLSFYISIYWVLLIYFFLLLVKEYRKSKGFRHEQLKYLLLSAIFGWFGAHCNFLPVFGIDIYPYANFFIVIWAAIMAYAILRHQLLDIEVIIKKTIIFSGLFTAAYTIFAFFALISQVLFEKYIIENRWVSLIPSVFVVTIMLRPLENFLVTVTDKYLFQKKYDYKDLLKTFMSEVLTVLEIDKLVMLTKEKLEKTMKLEYCGIIITDKDDKNIVYNSEIKLKIPITLNDKAIGALLLGKKKSDEEYTKDDIDILQSLTKTLGIAISNAKLFDELARTQVEMAQKDKMAAIGMLAAGMAHEILNPITTIRVFSEYVPDRLKDTEFTNKYKDIVVKEVDKIDHIIQTLIDFSGDDSAAETEMVSLEESIDELISLIGLNKDMLDKIDFIKEIPINISKIRVNRKEFDEILLNLTQNAMHAIEGKGWITFKAEEKNEFVELNIIDTGCGMSDDVAKNIFNPFFTTRSEGFGLGLFVVKQLVKRNGGDISVESKVGQGTKFSLMFKKG